MLALGIDPASRPPRAGRSGIDARARGSVIAITAIFRSTAREADTRQAGPQLQAKPEVIIAAAAAASCDHRRNLW